MNVAKSDSLAIRTQDDIVTVRQKVRECSIQLGFSLVDQTKVVTAASELARNTLDYGLGGNVLLEQLEDGRRRGLRVTFSDEGPGIADLRMAMTDGYTTGRGLGLGLGGAKRLMSELEVSSNEGKGTRVVATRWKE